jgi:hypothetical protein
MPPVSVDRMPDAGLQARLAAAERLALLWGEKILADPDLASGLERYGRNIAASREVMNRSEMVALCASCAREAPGGCCFREVEEEYDPVLLLINRLLGAALPERREVPDNCFFLGERGCKIPARYYFCVNFLCEKLKSGIQESVMEEVRRTSGEELQAGAALEYALRRWLRLRGVNPDSGIRAPGSQTDPGRPSSEQGNSAG